MFRRPSASARGPADTTTTHSATVDATISDSSTYRTTVPAISCSLTEAISSNAFNDRIGDETKPSRAATSYFSYTGHAGVAAEADIARESVKTVAAAAAAADCGPLPEVPLDLLAEIERELPLVSFRGHGKESGSHGGFSPQNSEKFRDTDSIRFLKQNRLSWWSSPVGVSERPSSNMEAGSPDQLLEPAQNIYEVVEESNVPELDHPSVGQTLQKDSGQYPRNTSENHANSKTHEYEDISEDFFLKQRLEKDCRSGAAATNHGLSTNPFLSDCINPSTTPTERIATVATPEIDFFLPPFATSNFSQSSLYDLPRSPPTSPEGHGHIGDLHQHSYDSSFAVNREVVETATTYDLPRKSDQRTVPYRTSPVTSEDEQHQQPAESNASLEFRNHYDVPLNLSHFATTPRKPIQSRKKAYLVSVVPPNDNDCSSSYSSCSKSGNSCVKLNDASTYRTFPRMKHADTSRPSDIYECVEEKDSVVSAVSNGNISPDVEVPPAIARSREEEQSTRGCIEDIDTRHASSTTEMLAFVDTYDVPPMRPDSAHGRQGSDLSSWLFNESAYDVPLATTPPGPPPPPPPSRPPPSSPPPRFPPPPPPSRSPPLATPLSAATPTSLVTSPSSLDKPTDSRQAQLQLQPARVPMRPQSPIPAAATITTATTGHQPPPSTVPCSASDASCSSTGSSGSARSSITGSTSGGSKAMPTTAQTSFVVAAACAPAATEHNEQIMARPPPVPAPRQKAPPPLPPKSEVTPPRASRSYQEHRKFSLQNVTGTSPLKEALASEGGNSLSSWYLDTNQIRSCDIPHRELTASSEDGSTDLNSMPSLTQGSCMLSASRNCLPNAKTGATGAASTTSSSPQRSGSKRLSSAFKTVSSRLLRKQSLPVTVSTESWDSNSADSDTSDGILVYFSQLDGRKDYSQRLCVIGDGFLKFYDNDSMTSPSLCLCCDEITLLLARRDICPSSKNTPSLFLVDVRASGVNRGLGFMSAIERADFLQRVNQSFNPESLNLQGEVWASGILRCRYSASGNWQSVKAVLHGKVFTPFPISTDEDGQGDCGDTPLTKSSADPAMALRGPTPGFARPTTDLSIDLRKAKAVEWNSLSDGSAGVGSVQSSAGGGSKSPPAERMFHIVLPNRTVYLKGPTLNETQAWFELLEKAHSTYLNKSLLSDQYLTAENVPLAIEKCVNFVSAHGADLTGVYRLAGSHVKIERLVEALKRNAWEVHLIPEEFTAHDVANALRRFLRSFDDCLLTRRLYESWIKCSKMGTLDERLPRLKDIISDMPTVEHATLRFLCSHLKAIADRHELNSMTVTNLASIFGPTILFRESPSSQGYLDRDPSLAPTTSMAETNAGLTVTADLIANFCFLFDVSQEEVAKEREIQRLMAELREARVAQRPAGDILVGVHVYNREWGRCLNIKLTPVMTALELCRLVRAQLKLADCANSLAVFEVICDQQLERPLHYSESVFSAVLQWTGWDSAFAKGNYLLVKRNFIYDDVVHFLNMKEPFANSSEQLQFAEATSKSFKKVSMNFARSAVQIVKERKEAKDNNNKEKQVIKEWLVEHIAVYVGVEQNRKAPTKYCLSFVTKDKQVRRGRDRPFLCHTIALPSQSAQTSWLASVLCAQHNTLIAPDEEAPDLLSL